MTFLNRHKQVFLHEGMFVLWACGETPASTGPDSPPASSTHCFPRLRETSGTETETMAFHNLCLQVLLLTAFLSYCAHSDGAGENKLHRLLKKRDVGGGTKPVWVAVAPSKAKEFLTSLRRPKRNIWDRSRPDVQQWIMQFMHMGGLRLTCPTGWTWPGRQTKVASTIMTRTPPSGHRTPVPTDTAPMSIMTTINWPAVIYSVSLSQHNNHMS
ncbi:uncharacterized protein [Salvelinus alpinus]|uniref:uncharacterized protein isoform X1 n=1 Tax=Salvelinus alpinus TaxID=8036 RepID=UPI0039FDAB1E